MGRPLNSKYFGPDIGSLRIQFYNGHAVVSGYVVKQTGSTRYIVTQDGITTYEVTLAKTEQEAQNLTSGKGTIAVQDADGNVSYVTKLMSVTCQTTSGASTVQSWSTDPDSDSSLVIDTTPQMEIVADGRLSDAVMKNPSTNVLFIGNNVRGTKFQICRNTVEGVEIGFAVHKYASGQYGTTSGPDENGVITCTVPTGPLTTTNNVRRASWAFDLSVGVGMFGTKGKLADYDVKFLFDLDPTDAYNPANDIVSTLQPDGSWHLPNGNEAIAVDPTFTQSGGDLTVLNQDSYNIGYQPIDPLRPQNISPTWYAELGKYRLQLVVTKGSTEVARIAVDVVTDPNAVWA